jgi:hypothetical protein
MMTRTLKDQWLRRPWWMNILFLFCLYMTFVYIPWDFFWKPVEHDREAWFVWVLSGWWAKATEPLHWLIYASGSYGFWKMRRWMWPWAALYATYVAVFMTWFWWHGGWLRPCILAGAAAISLWISRDRYWREDLRRHPV